MERYHTREARPTIIYFGAVSLIILYSLCPHLAATGSSSSAPLLNVTMMDKKYNEQIVLDNSSVSNEIGQSNKQQSNLYRSPSYSASFGSSNTTLGLSHLAMINFMPKMSTIEMFNYSTLSYSIIFDNIILKTYDNISSSQIDSVQVVLVPITKSPQFDIISFEQKDGQPWSIRLSMNQIKINNTYTGSITIRASYIGHALVKAQLKLLYHNGTMSVADELNGISDITVIRSDGKLEIIFKVSVITLVMITYIGLGSQIERSRVAKLMESPILPIIAFLITVTIMPLVSWVLAYLIVGDQLYYRFGAFVLSCCPMASAATMWATMFKADKELSITLQLVSTVAALFIMPIWMFTLGVTLTQDQYEIKIPYLTLVQTLISLLLVLVIGYVISNYSDNFAGYVRRIIRPVTFAVLIFIIVFSSYVYWFIYRMFDWQVILLGFAISCCTCLICGLLGYLYKRDYDHVVTIAIGSTYKNSGVAFSVLLVALPSPDTYIAFVPCLTQVLATSAMLYIILMIKYCYSYKSKTKQGNEKSLDESKAEEKLSVHQDQIDSELNDPQPQTVASGLLSEK